MYERPVTLGTDGEILINTTTERSGPVDLSTLELNPHEGLLVKF